MASDSQISNIYMAEYTAEGRPSAIGSTFHFYYLFLTQSLLMTNTTLLTSQDPPTYTLYTLSSITYKHHNSKTQVLSKNMSKTTSHIHKLLDLDTTS